MGTIFCIGRNYAAHAREMGVDAEPSTEPVVFLKPAHSVVRAPGTLHLPPGCGEVHHELEIVARVGANGRVDAIALGLDLTDRTRQMQAKKKGIPWTWAKGFRGSAAIGPFVDVAAVPPLDDIRFTLRVNDETRQRGSTGDMLHPIPRLIEILDRWFGVLPGNLVFTGTPEGVGRIAPGDRIVCEMDGVETATARFDVE